MDKLLEEMRASQAQTILRSDSPVNVNAVRDLGEEHRDELRATGKSLRKAIFEAAEVKTPTAFVVLKKSCLRLRRSLHLWRTSSSP